ncbi:hypothetical protein ACFOVS_14035 [Rhizobium lemnae]|uniref:EAL domain-containing protein n=1 Tax=Rhizobium lemnae TaxID=1214924 RepID=A0ABV8ECP8_9HYPH|nr:hypothetical protein [Rhizobium lemnae]
MSVEIGACVPQYFYEQQRVLIIIRHLKDLSVKIAMDDYDTGY